MSTADTGNSKPVPVDATHVHPEGEHPMQRKGSARIPPYFAGAEGFGVVAVFTSRNHL
jgi:hypothetical protein